MMLIVALARFKCYIHPTLMKIDKKQTAILAISFVLALVITQSGFLNILIAFLLVGAIPGTPENVSPTVMLVLFAAIAWLFVFGLSITKMTNMLVGKRQSISRATRKRTMPKRRYSRV